MGAGIAKQIKDKYPEAFEADRKANLNKENRLGYFSFCLLDSNPSKRIINLYTQEGTGEGRQVDYEGFYKVITGNRGSEDSSIFVSLSTNV